MYLPTELWLDILDILEENDDRKSLANIALCNAYFSRITRGHLYRRFIVYDVPNWDGETQATRVWSVLLFFRTMVESPMHRIYVRELKIGNFFFVKGYSRIDDRLDYPEYLALVSTARRNLGIVKPTIKFVHAIRYSFGKPWVGLAVTAMEVMICYFSRLESIHLNLGHYYGLRLIEINLFRRLLKDWNIAFAGHQLEDLKEVIFEYTYQKITNAITFPMLIVLGSLAPGLKRLVIRRRPFRLNWQLWSEIPGHIPGYPDEVLGVLERLKELTVDQAMLGEWDKYILAQHCKGLKSLTYINTGDDSTPSGLTDQRNKVKRFCNFPFWATPAPFDYIFPPTNIVARNYVDFSFKSLQRLEALTINQIAIILGRRQNGISGDRLLEDYLPLSLRKLRIIGFDSDMQGATEHFADILGDNQHHNLKVVELVVNTQVPRKIPKRGNEDQIMGLFAAANVKCTFVRR